MYDTDSKGECTVLWLYSPQLKRWSNGQSLHFYFCDRSVSILSGHSICSCCIVNFTSVSTRHSVFRVYTPLSVDSSLSGMDGAAVYGSLYYRLFLFPYGNKFCSRSFSSGVVTSLRRNNEHFLLRISLCYGILFLSIGILPSFRYPSFMEFFSP